jgi:hypothetical protein
VMRTQCSLVHVDVRKQLCAMVNRDACIEPCWKVLSTPNLSRRGRRLVQRLGSRGPPQILLR